MILLTNLWDERELAFDHIVWVSGFNYAVGRFGVEDTAWFQNLAETADFFKRCSHDVLKADGKVRQFAVIHARRAIPITWFKLVHRDTAFTYDVAFGTTLIKKNNVIIPFGKFPFAENKAYAVYRELKMKRRAYKYLSNQIRNLNS